MKNFILSFLLLLITESSSLADENLIASNSGQEDLYRNEQDLIVARKVELTPEKFKFIADDLERRIDHVLIDYTHEKINIEEAIQKITNPTLLKGSGYVLIIHEGFYKLVGTPTIKNQSEWVNKMLGGGVRIDGNSRRVFIEWPAIDNGENLFSQKNKLIAEALLVVSAEELYHVVQRLKAQNRSPENISNYFLKMSGEELKAYEDRARNLAGRNYKDNV